MMKFYGYIRVSTAHQAQSGLSLDAQYDAIKKYYEYLRQSNPGLEWGGVVTDDGESAFKKKLLARRGGRRLVGMLAEGDHVAFARLDRGFRNLQDMVSTLALWKAVGVKVHFLDIGIDTSTAVGELMLNVIGAIAQFESKLRSERLHAAYAARLRGKVPKNMVPGKRMWKMKPEELVGKKNIDYRRGANNRSRPLKERLIVGRYLRLLRHRGFSFAQAAHRIHEILCERSGKFVPNYDWHRVYKKNALQTRIMPLVDEVFQGGKVGGWGIRVKDSGYDE